MSIMVECGKCGTKQSVLLQDCKTCNPATANTPPTSSHLAQASSQVAVTANTPRVYYAYKYKARNYFSSLNEVPMPKDFSDQMDEVQFILLSDHEAAIKGLEADISGFKDALNRKDSVITRAREIIEKRDSEIARLQGEVERLRAQNKLAVDWIGKVLTGPASTMAEPKCVWYSTHSARVLAEIEALATQEEGI